MVPEPVRTQMTLSIPIQEEESSIKKRNHLTYNLITYIHTDAAHLHYRRTFWQYLPTSCLQYSHPALTSRAFCRFYEPEAGLLTLLHPETPSHLIAGNGIVASEFKGSSQLRDSRGFSPHSQLIAVKQTSYSVPHSGLRQYIVARPIHWKTAVKLVFISNMSKEIVEKTYYFGY